MKIILLTLLSITFSSNVVATQNYTIYLVRHAEKQTNIKDPSLTQCGMKRAEQLAMLLSQADIKNIYSTNYRRTVETATPLSKHIQIQIKHYDPRDLKKIAKQLRNQKENAVVVGHSNSTPQLAALLSDKQVEPLTELDYQLLYQIQFSDKHKTITVFKQPLLCN